VAFKKFKVDGIGDITVYKRHGTRSIRLSVGHAGEIKVSMPTWVPYRTGIAYVQSKRQWLEKQLVDRRPVHLQHGERIGRNHRLEFEAAPIETPRTRLLKSGIIKVQYPNSGAPADPTVQTLAEKACIRALRQEAEEVLPSRIHFLADLHDLDFKSVSVRQLKGRWGSCDQRRHITLNLFIMQLPEHLADYVLLHELAHTKHLDHSTAFWSLLTQLDEQAKTHRRELRAFRPIVTPDNASAVMPSMAY
jgi:predicted metal-dependent hydrolase